MKAALIVILIAVVLVAAVVWMLTPRCEHVVTPWYGYTNCR